MAKLMVWAALSQGKTTDSLRSVAKDVFSRRYFDYKRLGNMVESAYEQHSEMADLGAKAHKQAKVVIGDGSFPVDGSLASQRGYIRTALGEIHDEMELVVTTIRRRGIHVEP